MKDLQKMLLPIKDSVRKLYDLQQEKKKFDKYYEEVKAKEQLSVSNFMFCNLQKGSNSFEIKLDEGQNYYCNPVKLLVTRVESKKVTWFVDKLREKLTKEQTNKVINKTYKINDMKGLVQYLKECGVNPKKFKTFIDVEEVLDEKALDKLYETGEITKKQIEGCYGVKCGSPYIRITEQK